MNRLLRCILLFALALLATQARAQATPPQAQEPAPARPAAALPKASFTASIGYLGRDYAEPLPLSLVEPIITDKGVQGARLGLKDNLSTGRFLGHDYKLIEKITPRDGDVAIDAKALAASGVHMIVADLEPDDLLKISGLPELTDAIIINARSSNDDLRGVNCRQNVFHVAPSWAMRADALAQYMTWKKWRLWFLVHGTREEDLEYAAALKRAAKKFGDKIVDERTFKFDAGNRRTDTGHQQIQTQMPMLTQSPPEHDMVFVADVDEAFGEYLLWRTSVPKPVAGTQGLIAVAWHRSYEQYGGMQLQNRFELFAKRQMTERDYMAWLAVRSLGEAITRLGKDDTPSVRQFLLSPKFGVAGFKGQKMTFRTWDRQLRQPLLLTGPRSLVSMSPQDGFLHQKFLTDTLGIDAPETQCKLPG